MVPLSLFNLYLVSPFFRRPAPGALLPVRVLQDEELPPRRGGGEGEGGRVRGQQLRQAQEVRLGAVRGAEQDQAGKGAAATSKYIGMIL